MPSFLDLDPDTPFPLQNLPYGVFKPRDRSAPRVGVAIGDFVLDLSVLEEAGLFEDAEVRRRRPFSQDTLNAFMAMGRPVWHDVRRRLQTLLDAGTPTLRDDEALRDRAFYRRADVELVLPVDIGDYTDFYSSREHATNVGTLFRGKDHALPPNWLYLPVGYHGRASSVVLSGTPVRRPHGQIKPEDGPPVFGPSRMLDFELEMGCFVGPGNPLGEPIPIARAMDHVFGLVLVNDWSARDIQKWEYVPLGPFLGKNFATTISPWVVPLEALEPFRCAGPAQDPEPLPYLQPPAPLGAFDIHLEVSLRTARMEAAYRLCRSNTRHLYWSMAQQIAHHTVGGCNLRPGDLLASGTISGPTPGSYGSLLELTWRGAHPVTLPSGETRTFLEDGDTVIMTAWAEGDGYRVDFGEAVGTVIGGG